MVDPADRRCPRRASTHTRGQIWELGGDCADPVLWHARGVKVMKSRALKEPNGRADAAARHECGDRCRREEHRDGRSDTLLLILTSIGMAA